MGAILLFGLLASLIAFDLLAWRWGVCSSDAAWSLRGPRDD